MIRRVVRPALPCAVCLLLAAAARAQEEPQDLAERVQALEEKNAVLEDRLAALADEQESFALGELVPPMGESRHGLGPAASKVYDADEGLSIGGYGEALYQVRNGRAADELDLLRAVFYFGYRFSPSWVFNSEIEFEHAGEEVGVEFAYLDYLLRPEANFRAGLLLLPMGFLNELHEPLTYLTATRGEVERRILPSTWRENGAGAFGDVGPLSYRAYVVNGFDALDDASDPDSGFTAEGLRGGRQSGSEALAEDLALVGRLDWTDTPGLLAGVSVYSGDAGQDRPGVGDTRTTIAEAHVEWRARGLWARALAAAAWVDDVAELNAAKGFTGADSVGEEQRGGYVEAGYDVLSLLSTPSEMSLYPYARYERIDTQHEVPSGFASDPDNDSDVVTVGLHFRPHRNLVFKAEVQDFEDAEDGANLLMGYGF